MIWVCSIMEVISVRIVFFAVIIASVLGAVLFGIMAFKSRSREQGKKLIVCMAIALIAVLAMPAKEAPSPVTAETHITRSPVAVSAAPTPAETDAAQPESTDNADTAGGSFVASAKSDKFHLPDCSSAGRISPENRIWFDSAEEAEASGYSPCGRCKPG